MYALLKRRASTPEARLVLLAASTVASGTVFYHAVEGWGWIDSFYFCVITLATVGYGDLHPTTSLSKLFTAAYIVMGLGIIASAINIIAKGRIQRVESRAEREQK
ncbi:MAG: two pore domain potassium channel family protein [Anaerolineae bacterium]|nr:two pore domain potassium channel family protein [Anaerolineae bacterium]